MATTTHGLPYPTAADAPNGPAQIQALAEAVDTALLIGGKSITSTSETRTSTSYGLLTTPDRVQSVTLATDGLLQIWYQALWTNSGAGDHWAALFIGATQLKIAEYSQANPVTQAARAFVTTPGQYHALHTAPFGLVSQQGSADMTEVTTGQVLGGQSASGVAWTQEINGSLRASGTGGVPADMPLGGPCTVFAAAGTYDISVQFKATSGETITVKNRKLWVRALLF